MRVIKSKAALWALSLVAVASAAFMPLAYGADPIVKAFKKRWKAANGDATQQIEALKSLSASNSADGVKLLLGSATNKKLGYRVTDAAFDALKAVKGAKAKKFILEKGPKLRNAEQKAVLCDVLGGYPQAEALLGLTVLVTDKSEQVQLAAVENLAKFKCNASVDAIIACMLKADGTLEYACRGSLRQLTGEKLADAVDWKNWWDTHSKGFDFKKVAEAIQTRAKESRGKISTSVDGSGLYETIHSHKVLFVLDTSGSMRIEAPLKNGKKLSRLDYVKKELSAAINMQLDKDTHFNIIHFGDKVYTWKKKLVKASKGNKKSALNFVKKLKFFGMTNTFEAFKTAFNDPNIDTIYFLTDGTPTTGGIIVPRQILGHIRSWNRGRNVKIHTIAFLTGDGTKMGIIEDKGGSKIFMKNIAEQNGGFYRALE